MAAHVHEYIQMAMEPFGWDDELVARQPEKAKLATWVLSTMPDGYNCPRSFLDWLNA